jgi:hypothetical protein
MTTKARTVANKFARPARGRASSARNPEIGLRLSRLRDPFSCSGGQISPRSEQEKDGAGATVGLRQGAVSHCRNSRSSHMSRTAFSARQVYDIAPLGSLIRFYDGIPEPPGRHGQERPEWSKANGTGRLMRKTPASDLTAPGFILHVGGLGGGPTVVRSAPSRCRPTFVSPSSASPDAIRPSCFATNAAASPRSSISRGRDLAQCASRQPRAHRPR